MENTFRGPNLTLHWPYSITGYSGTMQPHTQHKKGYSNDLFYKIVYIV